MTATTKTPYRPVILIDCDGVLADIVTPLLQEANQLVSEKMRAAVRDLVPGPGPCILMGATPVRPEDLIHYDIARAFPGLSPADVYLPLSRQGFCWSLRPYPGAVDAVKTLQRLGEVYCVTKAHHSPYWHWERLEWLQLVMGIPRDRVIFTSDKERVSGHFFIDDNIEHVWSWMDERAEVHSGMPWESFAVGFLWDQPYNRKVPEYPRKDKNPPPRTRTRDWNIVIERVEAAAK